MTTYYNQFLASRFARQLSNYNHFVGIIKIHFDWLVRGSNYDCMYVYVDLLGEKARRGVMRGGKGEKHCKTSWFMEIFKMFFLPFLWCHYNKKCPCTPSDFIGFWVNSLVVVNGDRGDSNEFTSWVNEN